MSPGSKVKPIPDGMPTLTPHLVCAGAADAMEFYKNAFGAVEAARLPGPDGKLMHAMMHIGGSPLMLVDSNPQWGLLGPDEQVADYDWRATQPAVVLQGEAVPRPPD